MGIYDRDWWRERHNKMPERRASGGEGPVSQPTETNASWPRALLVLGVVVGAGYLLDRHSTRPGVTSSPSVIRAPAVAVRCADPFPGHGRW